MCALSVLVVLKLVQLWDAREAVEVADSLLTGKLRAAYSHAARILVKQT